MTLDDFLPYVLPRAKGCPPLLATQMLRLALIELCKRSLVWREYQTAVQTVADQTAYSYGVPTGATGQQVVKLLGLQLAGVDVSVVEADKGKALDDAGSVCVYAYGTLSGFQLRPAQAADLDVVTYSAVAPSLTATTIPDSFGRYVEGIAFGALKRLREMPDMEFSSAAGLAGASERWEDCIAEATADALHGFARTSPRVAASWM